MRKVKRTKMISAAIRSATETTRKMNSKKLTMAIAMKSLTTTAGSGRERKRKRKDGRQG